MAQRSRRLFTVEEHSIIGGLGSAVAEVLTDNGCCAGLKRIGLNDVFAHGYGNQEQVRKANGLDADGIYNSIKNNL